MSPLTSGGASAEKARTARPGVYVRPLPLRARDLPAECWWLKSQPWCELHLQPLAGAWATVYGERAV